MHGTTITCCQYPISFKLNDYSNHCGVHLIFGLTTRFDWLRRQLVSVTVNTICSVHHARKSFNSRCNAKPRCITLPHENMIEFQNYRNQTGFLGSTYQEAKSQTGLNFNPNVVGNTKQVRPVCPKQHASVQVDKILDMALINRKNMVLSKQQSK